MSESVEQQACRRCSECIGQDHHWMEDGGYPDTCSHELTSEQEQQIEDGAGDCPHCFESVADYCCKHCEAKADSCEACGYGSEPDVSCEQCSGRGLVVRGNEVVEA